MLPAGFPNPLLSGVINPLMAGGGNPFLRPNSAQPGAIQQNTTAEVVKKVFVKNIPPDVSDTFMELLLKVIVNCKKRNTDELGLWTPCKLEAN